MQPDHSYLRRLYPIYLAGFLLILIATITYRYPDVINATRVRHLIEPYGGYAPFAFAGLYIILSMAGFSVLAMALVGISLFPATTAYTMLLTADSITGTCAFLATRYLHIDFLHTLIAKSKKRPALNKIAQRIEDNAKTHGFASILILRMAFAPYIFLSYVAGAIPEVSRRDYILATTLSNIILDAALVFFGLFLLKYLALVALILIVAWIVYTIRKPNKPPS